MEEGLGLGNAGTAPGYRVKDSIAFVQDLGFKGLDKRVAVDIWAELESAVDSMDFHFGLKQELVTRMEDLMELEHILLVVGLKTFSIKF